MLRPTTFALLLLLGLCPLYALAQENLTKLSHEPVLVLVENGKGSVVITFAGKAGIKQPAPTVTEAVGSTNRISEAGIHFKWQAPADSTPAGLLLGQLSVDTQTFVEPGATYKGKVILLWPNAQPTTFDYSIQNPTSVGFDVSPEQADLILGPPQPKEIALRIKNTGKFKITKLVISSLGLKDAATGQRAELQVRLCAPNLSPETFRSPMSLQMITIEIEAQSKRRHLT